MIFVDRIPYMVTDVHRDLIKNQLHVHPFNTKHEIRNYFFLLLFFTRNIKQSAFLIKFVNLG